MHHPPARASSSPAALIGVLLSVLSATCAADATVGLVAKDSYNAPDASFNASDPIALSQTISAGTSSAFGLADLSAGVLKAIDISGPPFLPGYPVVSNTFAQTAGAFGDTFAFTGGYGQTAYLDWLFEGSIGTNVDKPVSSFSSAEFSIDVRLGGLDAGVLSYLISNDGNCASFAGTYCTNAPSVTAIGSLPILIAPGSFSLQIGLVAGAVLGDTAQFSDTARLFLRLPDGVGITSGSGQLLAQATPIVAGIPEPETYALILAGLGLLGAAAARQRRGAALTRRG